MSDYRELTTLLPRYQPVRHQDDLPKTHSKEASCIAWGKLPNCDRCCTLCGAVQFWICQECNGERHVSSKYCRECGQKTRV